MLVQLVLDQSYGHFTNLDVISGRVLFEVSSTSAIASIIVKLEGESRTKLLAPTRPGTNDRQRPVVEAHKLLYRLQTVFPPDGAVPTDPKRQTFSLGSGQYEYPFSFKLPFNNACNAQNNQPTNLSFIGLAWESTKIPLEHVKATLPPSMYFPGEAEIQYYVKVTVNRPSIFKENPRAISKFNFVPIEPPRPKTNGEVYARRQHQFLHDSISPNSPSERRSSGFNIFGRKGSQSSVTTPASPTAAPQPARFSLDARLPNPAILTCGEEVPLRILIKQLSERSEPLYLQTLQIELVGHTKVRAHAAYRNESTSWVITSLSNLNHEVGSRADDVNTETELTKEFWYGHPLPNTVPPSFVTCNLARNYELVVSIGLSYGTSRQLGKDNFIVLQLRLEVEVFSGIKPPEALLKRMSASARRPVPESAAKPVSAPPAAAAEAAPEAAAPAPAPSTAGPSGQPAHLPEPGFEEPPPSYEDAIAQDLPPVDGPRPDYRPPPVPEDESTLQEKR